MEQYNKIEYEVHLQPLRQCPLCGARTSMWEHIDVSGQATKVVMCDRGDPLGLFEDASTAAGCPLYMPDSRFYRARYKEAADYHRQFCDAVLALRGETSRRWVVAKQHPTLPEISMFFTSCAADAKAYEGIGWSVAMVDKLAMAAEVAQPGEAS